LARNAPKLETPAENRKRIITVLKPNEVHTSALDASAQVEKQA
jgi:hypothetical protein